MSELKEGNMAGAQTPVVMSLKFQKVMQRAKRDPEVRFTSLAHLLDEDALQRAYGRIRKDAAVGVDGVTKEEYGQELADRLRSLHEQLRTKRFRHQPILRVHIPKEQGKTRPIGISTVEDKIVQGALTELLEAIYEPVFLDCSWGFRRGRSAHDALRALDRALYRGGVNWVLEADIQTFFDSIDRKMLMEMLRERIADTSLLRLIGKCLHVGILDGESYSEPDEGTVQGSSLSPMLGNVYLHYVLDRWFQHEVAPRMKGRVHLIRYADDFVIGFEREDDARRVMAVLGKRFERFGLRLHPEKTRLLSFQRPPSGTSGGARPATFDFLGFTVYWRRNRWGKWAPSFKTRKARIQRIIRSVAAWCRSHRHDAVREQHVALCRRLNGHLNYYGVNWNQRSLVLVIRCVERAWHKWLSRRSQKRMSWRRFKPLLRVFPLPKPTVRVQLWQTV
jgi:RNA-directed DNA polymerase